jgi:hypothetical protein
VATPQQRVKFEDMKYDGLLKIDQLYFNKETG